MKDLELLLLNYWKDQDVKEIYKYKHRITEFREPRVNIELFTDVTAGQLFADVEDIANVKGSTPEEYKVSVDSLIQKRQDVC